MITAVLLDIEGTTTSIAFVHEVLFPYARERVGEFVRAHAEDPQVRELLREVAGILAEPEASDEELVAALERWMREDQKITPLKALQGLMWRRGYEEGDFTGHIYPDVPPVLKRWREAGRRLAIYSSGSVAAQQLLFGHSDAGDLRPFFSGYFDTRVGPKRGVESYQAIGHQLDLPPAQVLFLSDVPAELDAARQAGMRTIQLVRPGTEAGAGHPRAADFDEVDALLSALDGEG